MKIVIFISLLFIGPAAFAQANVDSVKQVVNHLFDAMRAADSAKLVNCFADNTILQTIIAKEGRVEVKQDELVAFAKQVAKLAKGAADEKINFKSVLVDADLASVWTPYKFYYNGKFSHCGVNSFQLVRINNVWKIQYLVDTRRKGDCNAGID